MTIEIRDAKITANGRGLVMYTIIATGKRGATFIPNAFVEADEAPAIIEWIAKSVGVYAAPKQPTIDPRRDQLTKLVKDLKTLPIKGLWVSEWVKVDHFRAYIKEGKKTIAYVAITADGLQVVADDREWLITSTLQEAGYTI